MRIKEYRFACDEVTIEREGECTILIPRPRSWREYFPRSQRFSDDYPKKSPTRQHRNARSPDARFGDRPRHAAMAARRVRCYPYHW
ncbi:MAG: hypothetical protein WA740_00340 [Candidatus Binataceae bacterium]